MSESKPFPWQAEQNNPWCNLVMSMPSAVVIIAGNGLVHLANEKALEFLGEPLVGLAWVDIIKRSFAPQEDDGHEVSLIDGRRVNIAIQSLGFTPGELIMLTDLTKTRQYEHERGRIARLAEMGEMTAHLAHQIRTPLASATLYLDNLNHPNLSPEKRPRYIQKLKQSHGAIEQLIRDLMVFAKGGEGVLSSVSVAELLDDVQNHTEALLQASSVQCVVDNHLSDVRFKCQQEALSGALQNLVVNAINAEPTIINIKTLLIDEKQLIISVIDDGLGMNAKTQQQILRPFFTTRAKGTGLGLAVVAAVAKAHGGHVSIQSELGVGSCISIILPFISSN